MAVAPNTVGEYRSVRRRPESLEPLTSMFSAMLTQPEPCFLHGDAALLTDLVSAIKLSAEQVSKSGYSDSKPIDACMVILGQPFTFSAARWCFNSHAICHARMVLKGHSWFFKKLV